MLADGIARVMEYVTEHYQLLDLHDLEDIIEYQKEKSLNEARAAAEAAGEVFEEAEEEEEEWDPFEGMEVGGTITVDSILDHGSVSVRVHVCACVFVQVCVLRKNASE